MAIKMVFMCTVYVVIMYIYLHVYCDISSTALMEIE